MNEIAGDYVGPMPNPPHLGELIRESLDDVGWNVTETAARLGCESGTLSRLPNGKAGVSANMALARGCRLGHRRALDADAGRLRACPSTPDPNGPRPAHGHAARMIQLQILVPILRCVRRLSLRYLDILSVQCSSAHPSGATPIRVPFEAFADDWRDAPARTTRNGAPTAIQSERHSTGDHNER